MPKQRMVFHIGLHKTATTSLQVDTFPHLDALNYLSLSNAATASYVNELIATDPIYYQKSARPAFQALEQQLEHARCNLLSSEALSGPAWVGVTQRGIDHRMPVLLNIANDFPEAEIILILRRQDTYAKSMYRQYIKTGGTESLERFLGKAPNQSSPLFASNRFCYSPFVQYLQSTFANVHLLFFEQLQNEPQEFMRELFGILGVDGPTTPPGKRNSTRIGSTGLKVCRVMNRLFRSPLNPGGLIPGVPMRRRGRWSIVHPVAMLQDHWPGSGGTQSTAEQTLCNNLLAECHEDNKALQQLTNKNLSQYGYY